MSHMEESLRDIRQGMQRAGYLCDEHSATVLFLAARLGKPVLVEGPAGVGKTSIAQAYAGWQGYPLLRLQCYEGIDESRALYEWNYQKQLLHIQAVAHRDLQVGEVEREIFSESFLLPRPLLKAIHSDHPTVLLVDEIDKVDMEFEAMLLELLSEYQITIPELGTVSARYHPVVFLTSNASRELSEALKRRCLYLYLDFPQPELERRILQLKVPDLQNQLASRLALALQEIRRMDLKKPPSIAEGIDWAMALLAMGYQILDADSLEATLGVLLKYREDLRRVEEKLREAPGLAFLS
jgi:MoxR-like ATPase